MDFEKLIKSESYDFLETNEFLGNNIMFVALSGSYAYGTNIETSDIDIRGVATRTSRNILLNKDFEQVVGKESDTTVFSFDKFISLLTALNPNCCELVGNKPGHYIFISDIGKELLKNQKMFLSKNCIKTFGGYATQQFRRLENALARDTYDQKDKERHILGSMRNAVNTIFENFGDNILLYIEPTTEQIHIKFRSDLDQPIREVNSLLSQLSNIVRDYEKLNHRNKKKDALHLNKHAMHLVRLYLMELDILEKEQIVTYRENEHELLMMIRNGFFQNSDGSYHPTFFELTDDLKKRVEYAEKNTSLPNKPNMDKINDFVATLNERVVKNNLNSGFVEWRHK